MKFLCDVHIAFKLVKYIEHNGFECIHVNSILNKWFTTDNEIAKYVDTNDYILISKDADFKNSHFVKHSPKKLIKINLGNISNIELLEIFNSILPKIEKVNETNNIFIIEVSHSFTQINTS